MQEQEKIDFVILWVDGSDIKWQEEKEKFKENTLKLDNSSDISKYRDWNTLKYWFRGVEKYASWVNKIHFVTCGQIPDWLNVNHPKLNLVNHSNFIDKKYLPTFNTHCIELNMHRIKNLSEKFVYFNDDLFILNKTIPTDFFKNGLPCEKPDYLLIGKGIVQEPFQHFLLNNIQILNKHFNKKEFLKKNFFKLVNFDNGKVRNLKNLFLSFFHIHTGFVFRHLPQPFLRKTFEIVWEKEEKYLNEVSSHKFRNRNDVNQYLMFEWQIFSNQYTYTNDKKYGYAGFINNDKNYINKIANMIKTSDYKTICVNDSAYISDEIFNYAKETIQEAFKLKFNTKSKFEL